MAKTASRQAVRNNQVNEATEALRSLVLAAYSFRQVFAASLDLSVTDTVALSHLAAAGPVSAGELAQLAGLAPSSVTAMLDRLERAGLAERSVRPDNRRAISVSLTDRGAHALELSAHWARTAVSALDAEQLPYLTDQLRALSAALTTETDAFATASSEVSLTERLDASQA